MFCIESISGRSDRKDTRVTFSHFCLNVPRKTKAGLTSPSDCICEACPNQSRRVRFQGSNVQFPSQHSIPWGRRFRLRGGNSLDFWGIVVGINPKRNPRVSLTPKLRKWFWLDIVPLGRCAATLLRGGVCVLSPLPSRNLGHVISVCLNILLVIDQLFHDGLFKVRCSRT